MIALYNPKATELRNRRSLSILAMAVVLAEAGAMRYGDGNLDPRPVETLCAFLRSERVDFWRLP